MGSRGLTLCWMALLACVSCTWLSLLDAEWRWRLTSLPCQPCGPSPAQRPAREGAPAPPIREAGGVASSPPPLRRGGRSQGQESAPQGPPSRAPVAAARPPPPVVAMTNAGNIDFTMNWLGSLRRKAQVTHWFVYAVDGHTVSALTDRVGEAEKHRVRLIPPRLLPPLKAGKQKAHFAYRSEGWSSLMMMVPRLVSWLLFEELEDGALMYSDTDIAWMGNPFSALPQGFWQDFDFLGSVDGRVPRSDPLSCPNQSSFCGGLFVLQANERVKKLLEYWQAELLGERKNQPAFNRAIALAQGTVGLRVSPLDCSQFPNGWRFFCKYVKSKNKDFTCGFDWLSLQPRSKPPLMVHVTYIAGAENKRKRLIDAGLWDPSP